MKKTSLLLGIILSMLSILVVHAVNVYIPIITTYSSTSSTSGAATVSLAWTITGSQTPPGFFMVYKTGTGNSYSGGTLFVGSGTNSTNRTGAYTEFTNCSMTQDLMYIYQVEVLDSNGGSGLSNGVLVTVKKCPTLVPPRWIPRVPPRVPPRPTPVG